jgi:phosphatidate cytidylyltransferase
MISATALGTMPYRMTPFTVMRAGTLAFAAALAAFLGGLVMSAIKRDRGVKSWSQLIPGHDGMPDRLDSPRLSSRLFYHLTLMFSAEIPHINVH